jgi:hypothetical protein
MQYTTVQINKVDNGFLMTTTKVVFGDQRPEQNNLIFKTFDEVIDFLKPKATVTTIAAN